MNTTSHHSVFPAQPGSLANEDTQGSCELSVLLCHTDNFFQNVVLLKSNELIFFLKSKFKKCLHVVSSSWVTGRDFQIVWLEPKPLQAEPLGPAVSFSLGTGCTLLKGGLALWHTAEIWTGHLKPPPSSSASRIVVYVPERREEDEGRKRKIHGPVLAGGDRAASTTSHPISDSYLTAAGSLMWHGRDSRATPWGEKRSSGLNRKWNVSTACCLSYKRLWSPRLDLLKQLWIFYMAATFKPH